MLQEDLHAPPRGHPTASAVAEEDTTGDGITAEAYAEVELEEEQGREEKRREEEQKRVLSVVTRNVIPMVWAVYFFSYLSRYNLTNMHVVLTQDLQVTEYEYGAALGAFYLGFVVFPVPANLVLERMKMSAWMALLVCIWGVITMLSVFIYDASSLIAFRFCLGITEAGLSPGVLCYITNWFSERYRIRQISYLHTAVPCSYIVSGFMSSIVLNHLDGILGLPGWKWLYIITGAPTVLLSFFFYFFLPNSPGDARFLTPKDRNVLMSSIAMSPAAWTKTYRTSWSLVRMTISSAKNWILSFCGMFCAATLAGVNGFAPSMIYEAGSPLFVSNLLIIIPSSIAFVAILVWAHHAVKTQERFWHIIVALLLSLFALGGCIFFVYFASLALVVCLLSIYQSALTAGYCIFVAEVVGTMFGSLSIGIAMYYAFVGFGGWLGTFVMGYTRDLTGDHVVGLALLSIALALAIGLYATVHITQRNIETGLGSQLNLQQNDTASSHTEGAKYTPKTGSMGGAAILV